MKKKNIYFLGIALITGVLIFLFWYHVVKLQEKEYIKSQNKIFINIKNKSSRFTVVGNMNASRYNHISILLPDGNVLIAGGEGKKGFWERSSNSAELYYPKIKQFKRINNMHFDHISNEAVLLQDGRVLISGHPEFFDYKTLKFKPVEGILNDFYIKSVIALKNNKILFTGYNTKEPPSKYNSIYLYNLENKTLKKIQNFDEKVKKNNFYEFIPILLENGNVFLIREWTPEYYIFNPIDNNIKKFGSLDSSKLLVEFNIAVLPNNIIIIINSSGLYYFINALTGNINNSGVIKTNRNHRFSITVLKNGDALIIGNFKNNDKSTQALDSNNVQIYKNKINKFVLTDNIPFDLRWAGVNNLEGHRTTLLKDGSVLVTGDKALIGYYKKAFVYK